MPRATSAPASMRRHRKVLHRAKGFYGASHRWYRAAIEATMRAMRYQQYGRKLRKRDFRAMWIIRISAACRMRGVSYSAFMACVAKAKIALNRKMLSELAIADPVAFDQVFTAAMGKAPQYVVEPVSRRPAPAAEAAASK